MQRKRNKRNAPELFDSKEKGGGEMEVGPAPGATRSSGRFWISLFAFVAGFTLSVSEPAQAQETPTCTPAIARIVSLQGDVEVQRGGAGSWSSVRRLDTIVCAGDRLRVAGLSRAALFLQPETLVRLDQNTTISLRQTADETHVELYADEPTAGVEESQCCGAVYLITRFPKKFKATTPHMNAAVEGTEFMVEASREASKLTVLGDCFIRVTVDGRYTGGFGGPKRCPRSGRSVDDRNCGQAARCSAMGVEVSAD